MDRYIVISPHTPKDCNNALEQALAAGYITHFDWGCKDGDHTGWAIIEAENAKEAMMAVPTSYRPTAKVVKLVKFSPEEIQRAHAIRKAKEQNATPQPPEK